MAKKHHNEGTNLPLAERHVNMSNQLARASHGLNLGEKRLIALALAKTDSRSGPLALAALWGGWVVRVTAQDFADIYGIDSTTAYEQLKDAEKKLWSREIRFLEETTKGRRNEKMRWVGRVTYAEGEGWIELSFFHELIPHLLLMKQQFTMMRLKQVANLRSVYSWRMLECLQSWNSTGRWNVSIEDFAKAMDVPDSYRKDFKAIRIRVIEPAIKELRDKDGLLVECELVKAGRKVTGLQFTFAQDPQKKLDL